MENILGQDKGSINTLVRALQLSQGRFSLIMARCNNVLLREQTQRRLCKESGIVIQGVVLSANSKMLYSEVLNVTSNKQTQALIIFGLESVVNIGELFATANMVRDKFKKDFPFPIVFWVTDEILREMGRAAPDLNTWATSIKFN